VKRVEVMERAKLTRHAERSLGTPAGWILQICVCVCVCARVCVEEGGDRERERERVCECVMTLRRPRCRCVYTTDVCHSPFPGLKATSADRKPPIRLAALARKHSLAVDAVTGRANL
jgi:hypothetical protein